MKINKIISLKIVKIKSNSFQIIRVRVIKKLYISQILIWEPTKQNPNLKRKSNVNFYNKPDNKGNFNFIKIVGKGGFGRVWKVT